ncbi:MAG TPA: hypothetical protein VJY31_06310 [Buttiauxella sp.]|nr:hypothetical protein [Buttiauxella sp.]
MIKPFLALLLTGSILLTGCDMELSQEAKSKVEETKQAANALKQDANTSVEELKNNFNNELQKTKDSAITSALSEETNKHIESVKQKAEDIGNMKVSELLSFDGDREVENEAENETKESH